MPQCNDGIGEDMKSTGASARACNKSEYPTHVTELFFLLDAQLKCRETVSIADVLRCAAALFRVAMRDPVGDLSWINTSPEVTLNVLQDVADFLGEIDPLQAVASPAAHKQQLADFIQVLVSMLKGFEKKVQATGELKQVVQQQLFEVVCTCAFLGVCHLNEGDSDLLDAVTFIHREMLNVGDCRAQGARAMKPGFTFRALKFIDSTTTERSHCNRRYGS